MKKIIPLQLDRLSWIPRLERQLPPCLSKETREYLQRNGVEIDQIFSAHRESWCVDGVFKPYIHHMAKRNVLPEGMSFEKFFRKTDAEFSTDAMSCCSVLPATKTGLYKGNSCL